VRKTLYLIARIFGNIKVVKKERLEDEVPVVLRVWNCTELDGFPRQPNHLLINCVSCTESNILSEKK